MRLAHPTPGIEPGSQIQVCNYGMSYVSANPGHSPKLIIYQAHSATDNIKVHRVFDPQSPQGFSGSKLILRQIRKVLYQARWA